MRRGPDLRIRLDRAQQGQHGGFDAVQGGFGLAFEAQHQHRRGVGGAQQAEAIRPVDPHAVDGGNLGIGKVRLLHQLLDQPVRLTEVAPGMVKTDFSLRRFEGDIPRALAAYNAGPEAVQRYGGVPPYAETQAYVRAILGRLSTVGSLGARGAIQ